MGKRVVNALMVGAGEYTTGSVFTAAGAAPDKPAGVVAITFTDLKRRGRINDMYLADAVGTRMPAVRDTMRTKIAEKYKGMESVNAIKTFPNDDVAFDAEAYKLAIAQCSPGDVVTIFTPDDTHFDIAKACMEAKLHVLVAKPAVKTLDKHLELIQVAKENNVLCCVEYHKRFDPLYTDARDRGDSLGPFSFFNATMTQPKAQLDTFKNWAGKSSDISYYLNSHHIDICAWIAGKSSRPTRVTAFAAMGAANKYLNVSDRKIEDTITLTTEWENKEDGSKGIGIYTASWIAPKSDSHTQQNFHYCGQNGEIRVNQARRGYEMAMDDEQRPFANLNPLYMKYTPGKDGYFSGQNGYGYRSIERFVEVCQQMNDGEITKEDVENMGDLATIESSARVTAILEAGRLSLDNSSRGVELVYDESAPFESEPTALRLF